MVISTVVTSFNVERHYATYSKKYDCYQRESRKRKLESLKLAWNIKQTNMVKPSNESEDINKASYKVNHILARNVKPYSESDGEIMKQAIVTFATDCCSNPIQRKAKKSQLSNNTVTRRIECISNDQHD